MEGFFMRNWRIAAVVGIIMVPWIGTLVWMQVTGETSGAAYEGKLLAADGTSMDGSSEKIWERVGENINNRKEISDKVVIDSENIDSIEKEVGDIENEPGNVNVGEKAFGTGMETGSETGSGAAAETGLETGTEASMAVSSRRILVERGQVKTYMSVEDYLPGVLVCQMPDTIDGSEYDREVWKCQAVIARTYICRLMGGRSEIHEEELDLDYPGETRSLWESSRDLFVQRLEAARQAVEDTRGVVMKYDGRYILPLFHEMSAGRTRQGHEDFPYIQSVDSSRDVKRSTYLKTMEWTKTEFAAKISQIPDAAMVTSAQLPQEIQTVEKDDAGYLLQIKIGARTYTGDEIRWALGLPSSCFSLEGDGDIIRARVRGSGHGYGLSQAGADSMAREGWGYKEILQHYYKNISLISE